MEEVSFVPQKTRVCFMLLVVKAQGCIHMDNCPKMDSISKST